MKFKFLNTVLASAILSVSGFANSGVIVNGDLTVNINESNGAIDSLEAYGVDWFNSGTFISDYGFLFDGVFNRNSTAGGDSINPGQLSISNSESNANSVFVEGTYANDFGFSRRYSVVDGTANLLRIDTSLTNYSNVFASILGFETFDPDPDDFDTFNDVQTSASGFNVALARDDATNQTFLVGSSGSIATAAGDPFQIDSAASLNSLINSPFDGNGSLADQGLHLAFRYDLNVGERLTTTTFLAVSDAGFSGAINTLSTNNIANVREVVDVPEPSTLAIFALGVIGLASRRFGK